MAKYIFTVEREMVHSISPSLPNEVVTRKYEVLADSEKEALALLNESAADAGDKYIYTHSDVREVRFANQSKIICKYYG